MIDALIAGHIFGDPEQRAGKAESVFVIAKLRAHANDGEAYVVNVIAFESELCGELLRLRDGDAITLSGSLIPKIWTDKQGHSRPAVDLVARRILAMAP